MFQSRDHYSLKCIICSAANPQQVKLVEKLITFLISFRPFYLKMYSRWMEGLRNITHTSNADFRVLFLTLFVCDCESVCSVNSIVKLKFQLVHRSSDGQSM